MGKEFIRVGSYKKRLKDLPEIERELWLIFDQTPFERLLAAENLAIDEVLRRLDYPAYFDLFGRPLPEGRENILAALEADAIVQRNDAANWGITNLGAILLAKRLTDFEPLGRKAVRVIEDEGKGRTRTLINCLRLVSGLRGIIRSRFCSPSAR